MLILPGGVRLFPMLKSLAWVCALALVLSTSVPAGTELPEAVADHGHHPGLGHPAEGEGNHEHGDADDHHETPNSPCHHHDTHTCCTQSTAFALVNSPAGLDLGISFRILVPKIQPYAPLSVVDLLHVPVV